MIACLKCHNILPGWTINSGQLHVCPSCRVAFRTDLFKAFYRPLGQGRPGDPVLEHGQAECFYHPGKKAVVPCASCGRLLCTLCEVELSGHSLCTRCLQTGHKQGRITSLEKRHVLYDNIALAIAVFPILLFWFLTVITGPVAIYFALRYWKKPVTILPRTRIRFVLAIIIGLGQVAGWAFVLVGWLSG